jgi:putative phosphoribosyl transferase
MGYPGNEELAIGAISETGTVVLNERIISTSGIPTKYIEDEITKQKEEIVRRTRLYRGGKSLEKLEGKTIILVDDGVATGATMKAAIATLKMEKIGRLVVSIPVSPIQTADELRMMADEFIYLNIPEDFKAVGNYYHDFSQVSDDEVVKILRNIW